VFFEFQKAEARKRKQQKKKTNATGEVEEKEEEIPSLVTMATPSKKPKLEVSATRSSCKYFNPVVIEWTADPHRLSSSCRRHPKRSLWRARPNPPGRRGRRNHQINATGRPERPTSRPREKCLKWNDSLEDLWHVTFSTRTFYTGAVQSGLYIQFVLLGLSG